MQNEIAFKYWIKTIYFHIIFNTVHQGSRPYFVFKIIYCRPINNSLRFEKGIIIHTFNIC